jgi:hypothetical protein
LIRQFSQRKLRAAADKFWSNEPFARNGGYQRNARIIRWVFAD